VHPFSVSLRVALMTTSRILAPYVLRLLAAAQKAGRPTNLEEITEKLDVRRSDVRATITALHQQGLLDATTYRLSLEGFAIGSSLRNKKMPPVRQLLRANDETVPSVRVA
jgi:DNA-binding IclR family transcriptional regulator